MHEAPMVAALVAEAEAIVERACVSPQQIGITVGALSGMSPAAVRTHWRRLAGPLLQHAKLDIEVEDDRHADLHAASTFGLVLSYVDVDVDVAERGV